MRAELIKELRDSYDNEPSALPKEADRMDALMEEAANELERFSFYDDDPYRVLSKINVNDHVEKKNGLSYLSWAWAWDTLMSIYPDSYTEIHRPENGMPYWTDGRTCWVDVSVTIENNGKRRTRAEVFPIMDYKNKSILVENVTSFDINTALQRAWTKCIARHGLGFYIYAGQDLPNEEAEAQRAKEAKLITQEQVEKVQSLYSPEEIETMLKRLKKGSLADVTVAQAEKMINKRDRSLVNDQTETF